MLKKLKDIREKAGLSQTALAERSGISRSTINKIENGKKDVPVKQLGELADALGCSSADLLDDTEGGWVKPHDDDLVWQVIGPIIDQAREHPKLPKKLLVAIAQTVYRSARNGHLPDVKGKGKEKAKNLAKVLDVEMSRLVEYEATKANMR